jgi:NAD(P)-dependent dehydrogenase (short-subunit alcohol dehydrogenase family)
LKHTIIVTSSNTGLGLEASRHLSQLGVGKIIMGVCNPAKGDEARMQFSLQLDSRSHQLKFGPFDMDNYDSIKTFASRISQLPRLDGILANAGVMSSKFSLNEKTLNINVIGTFLLYLLLLPKMRDSTQQTGNAYRYVIPNSALHYLALLAELESRERVLMERLSDSDRANMAGTNRYNLSKLLVIYAETIITGELFLL